MREGGSEPRTCQRNRSRSHGLVGETQQSWDPGTLIGQRTPAQRVPANQWGRRWWRGRESNVGRGQEGRGRD